MPWAGDGASHQNRPCERVDLGFSGGNTVPEDMNSTVISILPWPTLALPSQQ